MSMAAIQGRIGQPFLTKRKRLPLIGNLQPVHFAWGAFAIAAVVVYWPVVVKLVTDWWTDSDYSHGLLCAPLALALVIARRRALAASPRGPKALGLAGAVAALGLLLLGTLGAELFLTRVSLLVLLASGVLFLFGWRHLRALVFPFALLALSVPIPAILITRITLPLQFIASATTESALGWMSIPVLRDGNVLVLPNATLQVAEACSGIRSLVSLAVLALIVARYAERRGPARAAIIASAVPIAVIVNSVRVTVTAVATYWYGSGAVEGALHELTGTAMFALAIGLVLLCARAVAAVRWPAAMEAAA